MNKKIKKYEKVLYEDGYIKQSCGNYVLFSQYDVLNGIDRLAKYIIIDVKNKTVYWRALGAYLFTSYWVNAIIGYCRARYGFIPQVYGCKLDFIFTVFNEWADDNTFLYERKDKFNNKKGELYE